MSDPFFLSVAEVNEIHREAIAQFAGTLGLRDAGTLEAAVFQPQNAYFYGRADRHDIAAAYAFHIAEAQVFLDGNKRAAVGAALVFLEGNGIATDADSMPVYDAMIGIARKEIGKPELAALLRKLFPA